MPRKTYLLNLLIVGLLIVFLQAQKHSKRKIKHRSCAEVKGFQDVGGSCYAAIPLMSTWTAGRTACKLLHPDADLATLRCDAEGRGAWALTQGSFPKFCSGVTSWKQTMWIGFYAPHSPITPNTWLSDVASNYRNWAPREPSSTKEDVTAMYIGAPGSYSPAGWLDISSWEQVCAALCEVIVENSGKGCGLDPYGQPRRRHSHDDDRSFANRKRPSHKRSSESDSEEKYEVKGKHDRF